MLEGNRDVLVQKLSYRHSAGMSYLFAHMLDLGDVYRESKVHDIPILCL